MNHRPIPQPSLDSRRSGFRTLRILFDLGTMGVGIPFYVNKLIWSKGQRQIAPAGPVLSFKIPVRGAHSFKSGAHDPINPITTGAEVESVS
jgi:hypothetical protein